MPSRHVDAFTSRPHTRHGRDASATHKYQIGLPLAPPTHFPRCNSPAPARHPALRPTQFLTHWHHNPHATTLTSQPPIHSPHQYRHTPHHQHPIGQPTTPLKPRPDRSIQPSRPNTPTHYR